jgi:hypothetical protein
MSSQQQDIRVALICCLMFVWIEYLQNNFEGGLRCLRSGLKILDLTFRINWGALLAMTMTMSTGLWTKTMSIEH